MKLVRIAIGIILVSASVGSIAMSVDECKQVVTNPGFVHEVCKNNVINNIDQIRKHSPIVKKLEEEGKVKIIGAIYDMDTGHVSFLE